MSWQTIVERIVTGQGYDLVDCERSARGLLRVFIDLPAHMPADQSITVEDCEKVTRQLQYTLEVENVDYDRLEVSSPGLDRPLKKEADFVRFLGFEVELQLKVVFQGRKKYKGILQRAEAAEQGWLLHFVEGKDEQVLGFTLDEVREARLVPVVNFKGRKRTEETAKPASDDAQANEQA